MGKRKIQKAFLGVLSLLGVLVSPTWNNPQLAIADSTTTSSTSSSTSSTTTTTVAQTTTTTTMSTWRYISASIVLIDLSTNQIQARGFVEAQSGEGKCSPQGSQLISYTISPDHGYGRGQGITSYYYPSIGICGPGSRQLEAVAFNGLQPQTSYTVCMSIEHGVLGSQSACGNWTTFGSSISTTSTSTTIPTSSSVTSTTTVSSSTTVPGGYMVLITNNLVAIDVWTKSKYDSFNPYYLPRGGCGCYTWVSSSTSPSIGMQFDGKDGFAWPTTTTTTTTTTVAPTTTTVAPTTTVASTTTAAPGDIQIQSTSTTQAESTGNTGPSTTIAPSQQSAAVNGATTTEAPAGQPTPSTMAPVVPGEVIVEIGGEEVQASVEVNQEEGVATVSAGVVVASVSGSQVNESTAEAPENALVFAAGDEVSVSASGFEPDSEVDATIYSTPRNLGKLSVDAQGNVTAEITLPSDMETGNHTLVLSGVDQNNNPIAVKFGLIVYANETNIPGWIYVLVALLVLVLAASIGVNVRQRARLA